MEKQIQHYQDKLSYEWDPSDLFEAIRRGEKVQPVDARKTEGFLNEHIPGAINIPHRDMTMETTKHLDRSITYVTYCDGIGCNASTRGALKMATLGFNVRELIGGIEWWKFDGYATEGLQATEGVKVECAC